jgi:peptidoglycan/LPS O-acetylase OafA/YrhL
MLEFTRFGLSVTVLQAHILPLGMPWLAWQSVFAFYTLSGFLMTRVLHQRYGFSAHGFTTFALNRFLRLWPAYLVVGGLTCIAMMFVDLTFMYPSLRLPQSAFDWAVNFSVVGLVGFDPGYLSRFSFIVPNSWSLSIEVVCYLMLAAFFAKTSKHLLTFAALGAIALAVSSAFCSNETGQHGPYCFQSRYTVLQAGFIPFAIGGLLFFHADRFVKGAAIPLSLLAVSFVGLELLILALPILQFTAAPFVGSIMIGSLIVRNAHRPIILPYSDFWGRASYHLFIAQWALAAVLAKLSHFPRSRLFLATLIASIGLSALLVPMERAIERVRKKIGSAQQRRLLARKSDASLLQAACSGQAMGSPHGEARLRREISLPSDK